MNCTSPFRIYSSSAKLDYIEVPCGRCINCRINRTREWTMRLIQESDSWTNTIFVTLTYQDTALPVDSGLHKEDLQKFFKRLRKDLSYENRKIKYYACGEYGDLRKRPHYHAIIFGMDLSDKDKQIIMENWNFCDWSNYSIRHNSFGTAEYDSFAYVTGYIQKKYSGKLAKLEYGNKQPPFQICSQGLGKDFAEKNKEQIIKNQYIRCHGVKQSIPRYYLKKLFPDGLPDEFKQEREQIVQKNKLDKITDYLSNNITGEKIVKSIEAEREQKNANVIARTKLKDKNNF